MSESPGLPVVAVTVGVIGVLTAATILGQATSGHAAAGYLVLDVVVGVAACALVPALLRWPVPSAFALAVLAALAWSATPASTLATLQVALRRPFRTALTVGAAGAVGHLIRGAWQPSVSLPYVWWTVAVIATEAAFVGWGQLSQARHALLASLYERARRAEAEQGARVAEARAAERARMAREMHDVLAHRLSLLATYAGALEYRPDASPGQLARAAGVVRAGAHQALEDLREVISVLRDDEPADGKHPQPGLGDIGRLITESREAGTPVELRQRAERTDELPGLADRTVYRVVQEGLTNARKHAPGQPVRVLLEGAPGDGLTVELTNPAGTPGADAVPAGSRMGLIGLTERARLAGGELEHSVSADGEFRLRVRLPWPASQGAS